MLSFNIKPNIYGGMACRHLGIRFLPNVTGLGTALEYPGPLQALTCALYRIGVSRADCIFFQNRSNQDFFASRRLISPGTRSVLLPGSGVDLGAFSPLPYPRGDTVHFLFVSRILKEKGIDLYLHAARAIRRTHPEAVFHVCGCCDDPAYRAVMESAVQAGDIVYHGEQRDMRPFYEMACCVVHPSYYPEGMANALLEAAACARPIITTDRSGCAETVEDGRTGLLIPIRDQDALTAALERFLSLSWEQRRDMGRLGRERWSASSTAPSWRTAICRSCFLRKPSPRSVRPLDYKRSSAAGRPGKTSCGPWPLFPTRPCCASNTGSRPAGRCT